MPETLARSAPSDADLLEALSIIAQEHDARVSRNADTLARLVWMALSVTNGCALTAHDALADVTALSSAEASLQHAACRLLYECYCTPAERRIIETRAHV